MNSKMKKWLILGAVCSVSVVAGLFVPLLMGDTSAKADTKKEAAAGDDHGGGHGDAKAEAKGDAKGGHGEAKKDAKADAHGGGGHGGGHSGGGHSGGGGHGEEADTGAKYVNYGRAVVNLNENTLVYLSIDLTLECDSNEEANLKKLIDRRRPILRSWLIGYLADKTVEGVRGRGGFNRLRREILENFNNLLYPDGSERIKDVLFEEFQIQ